MFQTIQEQLEAETSENESKPSVQYKENIRSGLQKCEFRKHIMIHAGIGEIKSVFICADCSMELEVYKKSQAEVYYTEKDERIETIGFIFGEASRKVCKGKEI